MQSNLFIRFLSLSVIALFAAGLVSADTLPQILSRMDAAAQNFQSMTADMKQLTHTEIIDENDVQIGTVRLKKVRNSVIGYVNFTQPPKVIAFQDKKVEVYYPNTKVVEEYEVGGYSEQLNQFLLLGFGTSGRELQRNYEIRMIGPDTVAGRATTHIVLTPKSAKALEYMKKAELWIADDASYPVQEKIWKNADDYVLVNYSNVTLNAPLSDKDFALNLPPGVKRVRMGK